MKIQTRLFYLLSSVIALISMIFITFWIIDKDRTDQLVLSKKQEKALLLERSMLLLQKTMDLFVYDYSYWDEMLEFSNNPDTGWAYVNIDMVLPSFNVQASWVFNEQNILVYSTQNAGDSSLLKFPAPDSAWKDFQKKNYFTHFYVWTDTLILEIFGAPVQPSDDISRVSPPRGTFFAGRLWNHAFIRQLEDINNTSIRIDRDSVPETPGGDPEIIHIHDVLTGWDGSAIAVLHDEFRSTVVSEIIRLSHFQIGLLVLFGFIIVVPLLVFVRTWILSPLKHLSEALIKSDPAFLSSTPHRSFEFQQISQLVSDFFRQKQDLIGQIETRKKTERALKESENEYKNLFEFAHDAIMVIDREHLTILAVNEACGKLYKYPKNELPGNPISRVWPNADAVHRLLGEIDSLQSATGFEARHLNRDQKEIVVEINACLIQYQSRMALLCINRDITERNLIQSLHLSHNILMRIRNLVLVSNAQGHIIYANHAVKDLLGYELSEVLGNGWWNLTRDGENGNEERKNIQQAAVDRTKLQTAPYERWIKDRWGNQRCVIWSDSPAPGNLVIGVGYDITDRIRAQRALEASEQRYRFLFDHIPFPMLIFQVRTYAVIAVNQSALDLFGFTRKDWPSAVMKEWIEQPAGAETDTEQTGRHPDIKFFRRPDGSLVEIELQYHDFQLADHWFRLAILFDRSRRDNTEKADLRLRLQKHHLSGVIEALEDERRRMAGELHDGLGQILSGAKRILETLSSGDTPDEDFVNRMAVVRQMLDSALAETKTIAFNLLPRTLEDYGLFTAIENLLRQLFGHTAIRVNFQTHDLQERMPYHKELALYRIVQEALNNITRHAEATEVSVQFVGYESVIILTIEDNGRGFDAGLSYAGMGLRSIKDRVAYLDGNLHIDSMQGKGTSLIIEIPKRGET